MLLVTGFLTDKARYWLLGNITYNISISIH